MDSILRKQLVSLYLHLCSVFPTCYIQDIFWVSGHATFLGFFSGFFVSSVELHCSLPMLHWWLVLSNFGSCSERFLLKAESLTVSCHCKYSICSQCDSAYEFIFHCQMPTLQTASWHSVNIFSTLTAMSRKNRRKHTKVGNSVGNWACLFNLRWEVAMSLPQESYLEFNIFWE